MKRMHIVQNEVEWRAREYVVNEAKPIVSLHQ